MCGGGCVAEGTCMVGGVHIQGGMCSRGACMAGRHVWFIHWEMLTTSKKLQKKLLAVRDPTGMSIHTMTVISAIPLQTLYHGFVTESLQVTHHPIEVLLLQSVSQTQTQTQTLIAIVNDLKSCGMSFRNVLF